MRIKRGASIRGLKPEALLGYLITVVVYAELGYLEDAVLTSGTDDAPGRKPNSRHKQGLAFDIRKPHGPCDLIKLGQLLIERLGPEFEVVPEPHHLHVEYDP